ncbi:mechanosensitive ion channel family protein [Sediminicola luteus]|uniref:Mechanosensitive ion channel family protein n=1 Tax=Sediminicola luteus TaxID=319238 RepID=A0ABV2TYK5_9FLAO
MEELIIEYQRELVGTVVCILILLISRFISIKAIRKVGKLRDIHEARTRLIIKYVSVGHTILLVSVLIFVWGINVKDLGLVFSSVFAILGVALFANWSILSNITAGVILFFSFPFKIGDRIRILDKEVPDEAVIIDIKAFYFHMINDHGEQLTYPNNLLLQKGVVLIEKQVHLDEDGTGIL